MQERYGDGPGLNGEAKDRTEQHNGRTDGRTAMRRGRSATVARYVRTYVRTSLLLRAPSYNPPLHHSCVPDYAYASDTYADGTGRDDAGSVRSRSIAALPLVSSESAAS